MPTVHDSVENIQQAERRHTESAWLGSIFQNFVVEMQPPLQHGGHHNARLSTHWSSECHPDWRKRGRKVEKWGKTSTTEGAELRRGNPADAQTAADNWETELFMRGWGQSQHSPVMNCSVKVSEALITGSEELRMGSTKPVSGSGWEITIIDYRLLSEKLSQLFCINSFHNTKVSSIFYVLWCQHKIWQSNQEVSLCPTPLCLVRMNKS